MNSAPAPFLDSQTAHLQAAPSSAWRGVLAAIDMGSNSFRLEIGQMQRGQYRRIDYLKETVRLGAGLDADHRLTPAAFERGLTCLARFRQRLIGIPPEQLRAVATQTLREAVNRDAFLAEAQLALGHPIEVISGREEARLIYKGVARLQPSEARRLVIDIGGRSTEMILGQGHTPLQTESFRIGSVSLSGAYFGDGRFTADAFRAAQVAAGAELEEAFAVFGHADYAEALGSSGTAGAVSGLLLANGISDGTITVAGLQWGIDACLRAKHQDALVLPGLKADRRAVVGGGLAILHTLLTQFGIAELKPTRGALRQGVLFDLEERLLAARSSDPHDRRDDGVRELQLRFGTDMDQARRVHHLALRLWDDLCQLWPDLHGGDARRELGWAANLHEVGMTVSHHDFHRHSAYLVANADFDGFSQSQQRHLSALVLGQRGGLRKLEGLLQLCRPTNGHDSTSRAAKPASPGTTTTAWQATAQVLCLRGAAILCHARADVPPHIGRLSRVESAGAIKATAGGAKSPRSVRLGLQLDPGWAATHPRTLHLLQVELQTWRRVDSVQWATDDV